MSGGGISKSLSDSELMRLCPGSPVNLYTDIKSKHLDDCLGPTGCGFVLFVERNDPDNTVGHWLAMLRQGTQVEMFDPYGSRGGRDPWFLDHTFVPSSSLRELHESQPVMDGWIRSHGCTPVSNPYRFQVMKQGINTCGRHCAVRIMNSQFNIHDYNAYIRHYCNVHHCTPDELVTMLTS
jgi:hypothetical protein